MQKPRDAHGGRVAFVVSFIVVTANIALLGPGDFLLSGLAGAGQQLFDRGRRDFLPCPPGTRPRRHIRDPNHLEQRLRLLREAGKRPLPHEYADSRRLSGYEIIDGGKDLAVTGPASAVVQMAKPLNRDFAALILKDGKAGATQRQVGRHDPEPSGFRRFTDSRQPCGGTARRRVNGQDTGVGEHVSELTAAPSPRRPAPAARLPRK